MPLLFCVTYACVCLCMHVRVWFQVTVRVLVCVLSSLLEMTLVFLRLRRRLSIGGGFRNTTYGLSSLVYSFSTV